VPLKKYKILCEATVESNLISFSHFVQAKPGFPLDFVRLRDIVCGESVKKSAGCLCALSILTAAEFTFPHPVFTVDNTLDNTPMTEPKQRNSSLELLRIIAQLSIIAYHISTQSIIKTIPHDSIRAFPILFLGSFGRVGVDVFIIIGSFFLVDLPFRSIRFVRLYLTTFVYLVTVTLIVLFLDINPEEMSTRALFLAFAPFSSCSYWFISCYLFLLLVSPFLNWFIQRLPDDAYRVLYWILLVVFVILPTLNGYLYSFAVMEWQHSVKSDLSTMIVIYLIVGYWKKVKEPFFASPRRALFCTVSMIFGIALLLFLECLAGKMHVDHYLFRKVFAFTPYALWNLGSIICFGLASTSFFLFRSFSFSSPLINRVAKNILGIYILHQVPTLGHPLWNMFHFEKWWDTPYFPLGELGVVITIFSVFWLIDFLRECMMEPIYRTEWMRKILSKADSYFVIKDVPMTQTPVPRE
jgi:surface polysaccharide O-acyltransferase-like enzyme